MASAPPSVVCPRIFGRNRPARAEKPFLFNAAAAWDTPKYAHRPQTRAGTPYVSVMFRRADCDPCPARSLCTRAGHRARHLKLQPRAEHEALRAARERLATREGRRCYARRAGIEGTISQGVRALGLRRARYVGHAKTHLQHVLTAAAINLVRIGRWLADEPLAQTRRSRFVVLMTPQAA